MESMLKFAAPKAFLYGIPVAVIVIVAMIYLFFANDTKAPETFLVGSGPVATVNVSGTVKAAQDVDLGFAQSGRISAVYAKVSDAVHAGALLAEIENGDLRAAVDQRKAALASAQAKLSSIEAGTRPETIAVMRGAIVNDNVALIQSDQALADAIRSAYTTADSAVRNTLDEFIGSPTSLDPKLLFAVSNSQYGTDLESGRVAIESSLTAWQQDLSTLSGSSAVEHVALAQTQLAAVASLMTLGNAALNNAVTSASVSASAIAGWTADVAAARAALDKATSALTAAEIARAGAAAALDHDQKTLDLQEAGSTQQDIDAQIAAVQAAQADVENAQAQLRKTLVVAPFDGIVTKMDAKVGEVATPGAAEISMISTGVFEIECYVPEVSIASVAVGDTASVTLDAYGPDVGFDAKVIAIDPARTQMGGVSTYKTTLQFAQPDARIREGMTASVMIASATNVEGVTVPIGAVFTKDGDLFVQKQTAGGVQDVAVTTDEPAPLGQVRVTSGLRTGDVILRTPDPSK
jgi:RND family efflux transporter MFP subunit